MRTDVLYSAVGVAVAYAVLMPLLEAGVDVVLNERLSNGMCNLAVMRRDGPLSADKIRRELGIDAQQVTGKLKNGGTFIHLFWKTSETE